MHLITVRQILVCLILGTFQTFLVGQDPEGVQLTPVSAVYVAALPRRGLGLSGLASRAEHRRVTPCLIFIVALHSSEVKI